MSKVVQIKKKEEHGFYAIYENGETRDCELFRSYEKELCIGDVVWDERLEQYVNIETEKQIFNYRFVAPELYIIAKFNDNKGGEK